MLNPWGILTPKLYSLKEGEISVRDHFLLVVLPQSCHSCWNPNCKKNVNKGPSIFRRTLLWIHSFIHGMQSRMWQPTGSRWECGNSNYCFIFLRRKVVIIFGQGRTEFTCLRLLNSYIKIGEDREVSMLLKLSFMGSNRILDIHHLPLHNK